MKVAEIRELNIDELAKKIRLAKEDLADLNFKHSLNQLENPMMIRNLRREIARMQTIVTEKENTK
ncbi:MAG: 50S ribosomal protein L29 [Candidatus Delongbacteria bacterium]|nr:50S ribosomal protein L29 [Candidatus Delongbacteria bacterium]